MNTPTIYLLDDDLEMHKLYQMLFKHIPVTVDYFTESAPFLIAIKNQQPDGCIVDLNLENQHSLEGIIILKAIRKIVGQQIKIIISTANKDPKVLDLAYKEGANDYICKPLDKVLFTEKISLLFKVISPTTDELVIKNTLKEWKDIQIEETFQITKITEEGIDFLSDVMIKPMTVIQLDPCLFPENITTKMNSVRIESYDRNGFGKFLVHCSYLVDGKDEASFRFELRNHIALLRADTSP